MELEMSDIVILFDPSTNRFVRLSRPVQVVEARTLQEVLPALAEAAEAASAGLTAAGFVSYESAPAFDSALVTHSPGDFPLCRFAVFEASQAKTLAKSETGPFTVGVWKTMVTGEKYQSAIGEIKRQIAAGQTYQVNYTYRLRAPFSGDASSLFLDLLRSQNTPTAMFIEWDDYALCSLSPELFFQLDGDNILAKPMKGTASRGRYLQEDEERAQWLKNSEKNRAENIMIVDMIRNDLGRIAEIGSVKVKSLFDVERYPTAWQMTSTVAAKTSASLPDIYRALFPCASITGAPKASTMRIINELESTPRNIYTGAMGVIGPGRQARFNVAIRTVLIDKKRGSAEYGTGGGIVWDSDAGEEFAETSTKAQILFAGREYFQLLETMLWEKSGGYFLLDYHLKRMRDSAAYFGFPFPEKKIRARLDRLATEFCGDTKVRLLLDESGTFNIEYSEAPTTAGEKVRLGIANVRVDSNDRMLFHKTTRRSLYEQARESRPDCDDVILLNERGQVTETTIYNIVVRKDNQFVTPPLECGLLPGTCRQKLLEDGEIVEGVITPHDLQGEIFLINSVRKWQKGLIEKL